MTADEWPVLPYIVGGPVFDDLRFAGRLDLLTRIFALTEIPNCKGFVLKGPRRFGKSSVLWRFDQIAQLSSKLRVVTLDINDFIGTQKVYAPSEVTREILRQLLEALKGQLGSIPGPCRRFTESLNFEIDDFRREALDSLLTFTAATRLVISLDEIETAEHCDPSSINELVRSLAPPPRCGLARPFLFMVKGRAFGRGTSPDLSDRTKDLEYEELSRLSFEETAEAIRKPLAGAYHWPDGAVKRLWQLTSGDPISITSLGWGVHSQRIPGTRDDVSEDEIERAIPEATKKMESWGHAWGQLSRSRKLILRTLAEGPDVSLEQLCKAIGAHGPQYDEPALRPLMNALAEDSVIASEGGRINFRVELVRRWILNREEAKWENIVASGEVLSDKNEVDDRLLSTAAFSEQKGLQFRVQGQMEEAVACFEEALNSDPDRSRAAVWAGEIYLELNRPEEAARLLRRSTSDPEVQAIRARALARCAAEAVSKLENPERWIQELRSIDPNFKEAPEAAELMAGIVVEKWWKELERAPTPEVGIELTDHYILSGRSTEVLLATTKLYLHVEHALQNDLELSDQGILSFHVIPHLLRQSSPASSDPVANTIPGGNPALSAWMRLYRAEASELSRLSTRLTFERNGLRPTAFSLLLGCTFAPISALESLKQLVLDGLPAAKLTAIYLSDHQLAHEASFLVELVDPDKAITRLMSVFDEIALITSSGESSQDADTSEMSVLPSLTLTILRLIKTLRNDSDYSPFRLDLIGGLALALDGFELLSIKSGRWNAKWLEGNWPSAIQALAETNHEESAKLSARFEAMRALPGVPAVAIMSATSGSRESLDAAVVQEILGAAYEVQREIPYKMFGVPHGYVQAWIVDRLGRTVLARVYRVQGSDPSVQRFLSNLWENERRLLSTLGTRWEGRALPRLFVSRFARLDSAGGVLVLVTEHLGTTTLRELLDNGHIVRMRATSRAKLWTHIEGIVEALAALHRAGYIHRAIRPENIMADSDGLAHHGKQWLRLTNFEWSVYLYSLGEATPPEARLYDRYISPERFAVIRPSEDVDLAIGEGTASDAFALGLVLFECFVEPLNQQESRPFSMDFGLKDYIVWIEYLHSKMDLAFSECKLTTEELLLLVNLLRADPRRRLVDMDIILERITLLAQRESLQSNISASPLHVVSTLEIDTPESIARFIQEDLPDLKFADQSTLSLWLEDELKEAVVMPNRKVGAPLFVQGKTLNFTVEPFRFRDNTYSQIGWLKVARENDIPVGKSAGTQISGITVHNYRRDMKLAPLLISSGSWTPLFASVEFMREGLSVDERAFVERIRWTVELERDSWNAQVLPYQLVDFTPAARPGLRDIAVIRDRSDPRGFADDSLELIDLMAQSVDRENIWFELSNNSSPTAAFHPDRRWIQVRSGAERDQIRLERFHRVGTSSPPEAGWIRPYSLAGHRTIYERRKKVMEDVERDPFLIQSLLSPNQTFEDLNLQPKRVFNRQLDDDKKALAVAIRNRGPVFVVQGPPGTGKTTLAAEVILRTLDDQPSAHILVVAQAHDPLNNLLERVEEAFDRSTEIGGDTRPSSIRLVSEERLDERRYGKEATRIPRRFHPSRRAEMIMSNAAKWRPSGPDDISEAALKCWTRMRETQALEGISRSLERRLVESANIVYATSNDRRLAAMPPGSFDLVIYEEAAKALPVEILGPLRLARKWVLIGDQAQLAPFGLERIDRALYRQIRLRQTGHHGALPATNNRSVVEPEYILGTRQRSPDIWADVTEVMTRTLRFFEDIFGRARDVPLNRSLPSIDDDKAGSVKGLSGMLRLQWRMHPIIGDFVSDCFYKGQVQNGNPEELRKWHRHALTVPPEVTDRAILWLDVPPASEEDLAAEMPGFGGGYENGFEARAVLGFVRQLLAGTSSPPELAIMSPYRAQIGVLSRLIRDFRFPHEADVITSLHTVDSFQGKQADVVVLSLVRNNTPPNFVTARQAQIGLGFLESTERSTVMFSRAEKLLVIVGSMRHFQQFPGTSMFNVVREVERLSRKESRRVGIVTAAEFIDAKHWKALKEHYEKRKSRTSMR